MNEQKEITATEINTDIIIATASKWQAAADKAKAAAEAYLADLETRKATLTEQAAGYQTEIEKLNKERKALAAKINDLSSRGMIDEAVEADTELEALDKSISTLERKLRLASTAELKGDPKLYKVAKAAYEAAEAERTPYRENMEDLIEYLQPIINAELRRLESIREELITAKGRDIAYDARRAFDKVTRHYLDLDRLEREAKEKAEAERKEAEANAGRYVRHIV